MARSNVEDAFLDAKLYMLQSASGLTDGSGSLYEHLTNVFAKLIEQRPNQSLDVFESISAESKRAAFVPATNEPVAAFEANDDGKDIDAVEESSKLFKTGETEFNEEGDPVEAAPINDGKLSNILEELATFEQAGVVLGSQTHTFRVYLALKQLVESKPLESVRLWGRIAGTSSNYYIAECEFKDGQDHEEAEESEGAADAAKDDAASDADGDEKKEDPEAGLPKPQPIKKVVVPKEEKSGPNKYAYFVTSAPGQQWRRLPDVTPAQIAIARLITKRFTGNLDAAVNSYPAFPGTEAHYLRAQIARITASTFIAPRDFYQFEDGDDDPEDDEVKNIMENDEFDVLSSEELQDGGNWSHVRPNILPQGRTIWWNPKADEEDNEDDDDDASDAGSNKGPVREEGPQLLTVLADDAISGVSAAWSFRLSPASNPRVATAFARSNVWPGAITYALGRKFASVYVGDGLKYSATPYQPALPQAPQNEAPELVEQQDPTAEAEKALKGEDSDKEEDENDGSQKDEGDDAASQKSDDDKDGSEEEDDE